MAGDTLSADTLPERESASDSGSGAIVLAREPGVRIGSATIDPARRRVRHHDGRLETVQPRVMQVLVALLNAGGRVVSRDELTARCWGGRIVGEDAINRAIMKCRRIADSVEGRPFTIETVPKVGVRLSLAPGIELETRRAGNGEAAATGWLWRKRAPIAAAVALIALVGISGLVGLSRPIADMVQPRAAASSSLAVAVLPFRTLSSGDDYLAEGVAEDLLQQLGRQPNFRPVGRSSAWLFRDRAVNFSEIGRNLGVDYVVDGSVRRENGRIKFDVSLIRAQDGIAVWTRSFSGDLERISVMQAQLVRSLASELTGDDGAVVARSPELATSGEVYSLYVKARSLLRTGDVEKSKGAVPLLRKAVALDPDYAPAWAALSIAVGAEQGFFADPSDIAAAREEAIRYARRAVRLAPELGDAHAAMGEALNFNREALAHFERAARLNPHNAQIWFGLYVARWNSLDHQGALDALRRVAAIDPLWEGSRTYPRIAWSMGLHEEAERFYRQAISAHPDPSRREALRADRAWIRTDWSGYVIHSLAAGRLASPGMKARSDYHVGSGLLRLGFLEEGRRYLPAATDETLAIGRGEAPSLGVLRQRYSDARDFWSGFDALFVPALLVNSGRGADLLLFYDRAFSSPEDMAEHAQSKLWSVSNFLYHAPPIAIALREAGRNREADRLLGLAEHLANAVTRRGQVDVGMYFLCARIWAVQGNAAAAIGALAKVEAAGLPHWQYVGTHFQPRLVDDPSLRSLRNHPLVQRMDDGIQAHLLKERRELQIALNARRA